MTPEQHREEVKIRYEDEPAAWHIDTCLEWLDKVLREHEKVVRSAPATEDTSDGYHTFKELYEFRKLYNAALFNEWARLDKVEHETDMPYCWCNPRKEVQPNGDMVIVHHHFNVHKSKKHSDGQDCFGGDWFIVMATLPSGQISNHYEMKDWNLFKCDERELADKWDGHTPQDVLTRLRSTITS